ncbi:MAG: polyketide cyclase, partial [Flavobacteriales bacterium]|nr:polyketide cyclase [Flavobacteriales bacterium]
MRALKTILIILLALVAILVILGLMGPNDFRVERSAVIKAPVEVVYANVSSLGSMDKWGPWKETEHNMTATMSG